MNVLAAEWKEIAGPVTLAQMPPVELEDVLNSICEFLQRYIVFSSAAQQTAIALWVAHTWALNAFDCTPYLHVSSPEKRSGKTKLLDCVELIVPEAWRAVSPSEAVLYRKIGRLPDTITDRCIPIRLIRKSRDESLERFRKREAEAIAAPISAALEAWATCNQNIAALRASRPTIPDELNDRQTDICEPLLAIADLAGGEWPERSRSALVSLCTGESDEDESIGVKLLSAIREVFQATGADRLATKELLEQLVNQDTDAPWASWWEHDLKVDNIKGPGARLAKYLKPYDIKSRGVRLTDGTTRGYMRDDFEDAWRRYCPPKTL